MDINGREYAFIIWMVFIIITLNFKKDIRDSFFQLIKVFKHRLILTVLGLAVIWVIACVILLYEIGLWSSSNLKTTLVWMVTYAFVTIFEVNKIKNSKYFFKSQLKETIGISTLLTFILELHSFSFTVEFIMFPIVTFLSLLSAVGGMKTETKKISVAINVILATVVIFYFAHSLYLSIISMKDTFSRTNLTELLTPILLSFSFMPFIYILYLYQAYERKLISLKIYFDNDEIFKYARNLAIYSFRTDLDGLNRWVRNVHTNRVKTKEELKAYIRNVKLRKKLESNPPIIPHKSGWSPFLAKEFLVNKGYETNDYHFSYDTWWSYSETVKIGADGLLQDNITYYIYGNEHLANKLKLRININQTPISEISKKTINDLTIELLSKSIGMSSFDINTLINKLPVSFQTDCHNVLITRENFVSNNGGFTLEVIVSTKTSLDQNPNDLGTNHSDVFG